MKDIIHIPVLFDESVASLAIEKGETLVDCTVNRGTHAEAFAKKLGKDGTIVIFDLDKNALEFSKKRLEALADGPKVIAIHSNYRFIKEKLAEIGITEVHKIFADLGLSSEELEISGRGFSFMRDEPLLMTFQSEITEDVLTARDLLKNLDAAGLESIFKNYGEETRAKKIAEKIAAHIESGGVIDTTKQLVEIITSVVPYKPWLKTHPATKVFQALRIAVNDEYDGVRDLLDKSLEILSPGGKMSIITFHSGEDRIVKNIYNDFKAEGKVKLFQKQKPSGEEIRNNRRSRSALLRTFEKL